MLNADNIATFATNNYTLEYVNLVFNPGNWIIKGNITFYIQPSF